MVASEIPKRSAISRSSMPSAHKEIICSSRTVSEGAVSASLLIRKLANAGVSNPSITSPLHIRIIICANWSAFSLPTKPCLYQLVPITLDGKTRRTKNRHMLAHQTQPTTSSRPLQTLHRHIKNQQTDIAVRVLTAFYRLIARSRSPHHICGRHFAGNDGTERIQRSRIIVDQRDAMNLRMPFRRGHYAITFLSHTAIAAMLGSWDSRQWRYRRCRQRELLHTHMLVCW